MSNSEDRRGFLRRFAPGATVVGGVQPSPGVHLKAQRDRPIRIGFIGVRGRGSYHLDAALGIEGVDVPCVCDVNEANLYQAKRWVEESGRPPLDADVVLVAS
jgi:hypothetical protein